MNTFLQTLLGPDVRVAEAIAGGLLEARVLPGYALGDHLHSTSANCSTFFYPLPLCRCQTFTTNPLLLDSPLPSQNHGSADVICERSLDSRDFFADEIPAGQPALGERAGGVKVQFLDVPVAIAVIVIPLARDLEAAELQGDQACKL